MHAMKPLLALLLAPGWLFAATPVRASDPCPQLRLQVDAPDVATRIAAFACQENHAWFRTFIDADGRAGGQVVYDACSSRVNCGLSRTMRLLEPRPSVTGKR